MPRQRKEANLYRKKVKECEEQFHAVESMCVKEKTLKQIARHKEDELKTKCKMVHFGGKEKHRENKYSS